MVTKQLGAGDGFAYFFTHYFIDVLIKQIQIKYSKWTPNTMPTVKEFTV